MPRIEGRGRYTPVDDLPQAMPRIEGRGRYTPDDKPPSFSLKDLKEMGIDPRTMSKGGSNVVLPKKKTQLVLKRKKTSEQIIREKKRIRYYKIRHN